MVRNIVTCKQGYAEVLLFQIKQKIEKIISHYNGTEPTNISLETGEKINAPHRAYTASASPDRKVLRLSPSRLKEINLPITLPELPRGNDDLQRTKKPPGVVGNSSSNDDKDRMILEMKETINTLGIKVGKLETLLALKDKKIEELVDVLRRNKLLTGSSS